MTARVEMKREILILWRMELHTESMCEQRLVELDVQFVYFEWIDHGRIGRPFQSVVY